MSELLGKISNSNSQLRSADFGFRRTNGIPPPSTILNISFQAFWGAKSAHVQSPSICFRLYPSIVMLSDSQRSDVQLEWSPFLFRPGRVTAMQAVTKPESPWKCCISFLQNPRLSRAPVSPGGVYQSPRRWSIFAYLSSPSSVGRTLIV